MAIVLREGEELNAPSSRTSDDGRFVIAMTQSGYLNLFRHELGGLTLLWRHHCNSGIAGVPFWARLHNGNFQGGYVFNNVERLIWSYPRPRNWGRPVPGPPGAMPRRSLHLQDDGNLVLYQYNEDDSFDASWATDTYASHDKAINPDFPTAVLATGTLAINANTFAENATNAPINVYDGNIAVVVPPGESVAVLAEAPGSLAIDVCLCRYNYDSGTADAYAAPNMTTQATGNIVRVIAGDRRRPDLGGNRDRNNFSGSRLPDVLQWFDE